MFELGQEYDRTRLLDFIGSKQRQTGIIWGPKQSGCVIVTSGGKHSKSAGYEDNSNPDGSWTYFGQGSEGDQDPERFANKLLIEAQKSVLLFSTREPTNDEFRKRGTRAKLYRFEGVFNVRSYERYSPTTGPRSGDVLLLFHLMPAEVSFGLHIANRASSSASEDEYYFEEESFEELRLTLLSKDYRPLAGYSTGHEYRRASELIKKYSRLRANGTCEYCDKPAPFVNTSGQPFLEVHHIHRLADDGPDIPTNVAAICPNCHREAHHGQNRERFEKILTQRIWLKERALDES